jgi:hypothetical protein
VEFDIENKPTIQQENIELKTMQNGNNKDHWQTDEKSKPDLVSAD